MTISLLTLVSNIFFAVFDSFWWLFFAVITLGVACIPIRLSQRHYY